MLITLFAFIYVIGFGIAFYINIIVEPKKITSTELAPIVFWPLFTGCAIMAYLVFLISSKAANSLTLKQLANFLNNVMHRS